MAKNRINVDVKVSDKGSLKQVGDRSRSADRTLKGLAKTSSSGTKNFSKMSQGITGGLVPAYATLAANLFAITALFAALKEAADLRVMREGMTAYAETTGIAMISISNSLRQVTHAQLSYGDAMKATATLTAAGFNKTMIEEMGKAARQASAAIGHGFEDAFNRITKGIQKAEPELLDELGIILRLDQATRNYAIANKLAQDDLTLFQRTLAVHNEVISQATEKYGALNREIRVSGITQLGTAFENVKQAALEGIAPIAELFAGVFQKNIGLVITAMAFFGISMLKAAGIGDSIKAKTTEWTTNAQAKVTAVTAAQENYTLSLKESQMTMDEIKAMAAGNLQGYGQNKKLMKGTGDFEGKQRLAAGQIGMIPARVLKDWKKMGAGMEGVTKNMTAKQVRLFHRMIDDILLKEKRFEQAWGKGMATIVGKSKIAAAHISSAFARVGATIGRGVSNIGAMGGKLLGIAGKLAIIKMLMEFTKTLSKNSHEYVESLAKIVGKIPLLSKFSDQILKSSKSWREMRAHAKKMTTHLETIASSNEAITKMKEEVKTIADNWDEAASQLEKYTKLGRLMTSADFTQSIEAAASAYTRITEDTNTALKIMQKRVEDQGGGEYMKFTPMNVDKAGGVEGGKLKQFFRRDVTGQDWKGYAAAALKLYNETLDDASKLIKDSDAAKKWQATWIDVWKTDKNMGKIIANQETTLAVAKENILAMATKISATADEVIKKAEETGLKGDVKAGGLLAAYITNLETMDPDAALKAMGKTWQENIKPLVEFTGEMDTLKSVSESYNKTANKLFKEIMPSGWGKQVKNLQDYQNFYNRFSKEGPEKLIDSQTKMDAQHIKMFNTMGIITNEMIDDAGEAGFTWAGVFGPDGPIQEAADSMFEQAYGFEKAIQAEKRKQIELMDISQKLGGVAGKKAQYLLNVEKNISMQKIKQEELARLAGIYVGREGTEEYKIKKEAIDQQNLALEKQLEIMKEQETIQFKLVNMMQMSFTNLFEELVKGEEKLGETFKKVTRQMLMQMAQLMAQQAALAAMGFMFPSMMPAMGGREGGVFSPPGYKSFGGGGYASGPQSGYLATLHGNEAVIPLGNDKSIPVKFDKSGGYKETNITVNVTAGGQQQTTTANAGERERKLGQMIAAAVQGEILDQQRPGGILSPYGDGGV